MLCSVNRVRTKVILFLLVALPLSSLADITASCKTPDPATSRDGAAWSQALHAEHAGMNQAAAQGSITQLPDTKINDSRSSGCPCCDDCGEQCAVSGCSQTAVTSELTDMVFDGQRGVRLPTTGFRAGPVPHTLFRPPIPIA